MLKNMDINIFFILLGSNVIFIKYIQKDIKPFEKWNILIQLGSYSSFFKFCAFRFLFFRLNPKNIKVK